MAAIRTILKKSKTNSKGEHPILLRVADSDNNRTHFATGFYSTEKFFDTSKEGGRFFQGKGVRGFNVERKEEDGSIRIYTNREANDKLAALENRASEIMKKYREEHISWNLDRFRADFIDAPKKSTFLSFAEQIVEKEYRDRGQHSTANTVKYTIISLKRFDKDLSKRLFEDINTKYLNNYERFCREEGAQPGTISIRMRVIKRVFNIAIRDSTIERDLYPFSNGKDDGKYKIPQPGLTKTNQFLTIESLKKLANKTFDSRPKERDKHLFLFSFYCMGINWKDMALLKQSNFHHILTTEGEEVTVLRYKRAKTQGDIEIMVVPNIQKELDWFRMNTHLYSDYVLPIISLSIPPDKIDGYLAQKRKRFNSSLKVIAKELELPESQLNMTSYHARHSFAMALLDKGRSVEIISQALGHQSVETTKHYLAKFSTTKMAEETDIDLSE